MENLNWPIEIGVKPYYQDEAVVIYHADCRDILPLLPAGSVDLVLTDPPYGVGFDYGTGYADKEVGYADFLWPVIHEAERSVKPGQYVAVYQASKHARRWHEWFPREWRLIALPKKFGQIMPTDIQFRTDYVLTWNVPGKPDGRPLDWRDGNVFQDFYVSGAVLIGRDALLKQHPCPRPIDQSVYLLNMLCPPKGVVLDPFAGSGTTGRAAKDLGRRAILVEIEERYCEIAAKRMAQTVMALEI